QTYDKPFIQKWLSSGNRTCPQTQQVLSHTLLTPNHLIHNMITQYCKNHGINLPDPAQHIPDEALTQADKAHFLSLLTKMSSMSSEQQQAAAKQLRLLTKQTPSFRALFGESPDFIPKLLSPLSRKTEVHLDLQEDIITTLLNISIHDNNKKLVAETPAVIDHLIAALKKSGTIGTRSNAAAALFTLSALDSNKALIGKSGALRPLIDLLDEGHPSAMKDVASAIFNLCIIHENKVRAVRDGGVRVILEKIACGTHVDELLSILAMLSTNQRAVEEMGELDAVSCLLGIIRETDCARNQENCMAILFTICFSDRSKLSEMREEENTNRTISKLARNGTSRAKRKANGILERLNRAVNLTHTA
ncbi:U-box domain-containing protein 9, partial [Phtheirospermum japonicum]